MKIIASIAKVYPIFLIRNYRLYFFGLLVSLVGTWMQTVVLGWQVQILTGSIYWVGVIMALPYVISIVLVLPAGALADYFDKRRTFVLTQSLGMIQAFALAVSTIIGFMPLWWILSLTVFLGIVTSLETPIRQSFFTDFLEERDIPAAASLNTTITTASMILGPGLGGVLIAVIGFGGTYILNGVSFLAVVITLAMMRIAPTEKKIQPILKMFREGIWYTVSDSKISLGILLGGVAIMFGFSSRSIMPAMTKEIFHSGSTIFGLLMSLTGLGAWLGSVFVSARVKKEIPFRGYVLSGMILTGSTVAMLSDVSNLAIACALFFLSGIGMTLTVSTSRAELMSLTVKEMRGRVTSITMSVFLGGMGAGNYLAALVAEKVSIFSALLSSGLGLLAMALVFFFLLGRFYGPESRIEKIIV